MKLLLVSFGVVVSLMAGFGIGNSNQPAEFHFQEQSLDDQFLPVDNMHHFMEYISEPGYKALKASLASEPEGRKGWKPVKVNA